MAGLPRVSPERAEALGTSMLRHEEERRRQGIQKSCQEKKETETKKKSLSCNKKRQVSVSSGSFRFSRDNRENENQAKKDNGGYNWEFLGAWGGTICGVQRQREPHGCGNSMATAELEGANIEHVLRKDGSDWKH